MRISVSNRVRRGLVLPRATMSNDWISGTPARIMVESCRVKTAMSFCLIALPPRHPALLHLGDHDALAAHAGTHHGLAACAHLASDDLPVLVLAFPLEDDVLGLLRRDRCRCCCCRHGASEERIPRFLRETLRYSLVTEITSSSVVTPARTLMRPDWRRSRTFSRCAWLAMSMDVPSLRMIFWISSVMGITW